MKLFLASEAKHPETIKKLREFVGGFEGKTIAYIPTAANGENKFEDWRENSGSWKLVQTLGADVIPIQLEDYKDERAFAAIKRPDILWVAGGFAGYLMYWLLRTQIAENIREILEDWGTTYVGSSAGSMVTAKTLDVATWYPGEYEIPAKFLPGLGLVDFDIFPHYEDDLEDLVQEKYEGNKLYLLKNGEQIIVDGGKITVQGEEMILRGKIILNGV